MDFGSHTRSHLLLFCSAQVTSGMLQSPGMPTVAFQPLLKGIVDMYGKTVHTWQVRVQYSPSLASRLPASVRSLSMSC